MAGKIEKQPIIALNKLWEYALHKVFNSSARCLFVRQRNYSVKLRFITKEVANLHCVGCGSRKFLIVFVVSNSDDNRIAFAESFLSEGPIQNVPPRTVSRFDKIIIDTSSAGVRKT